MLFDDIPKNPSEKRCYTRHWADTTAAAFLNKYTRASEVEKAVFQINDKDLGTFLQYNDPFWHLFTKLVKMDEKYYEFDGKPEPNILHMRVALIKRIGSLAPPELAQRVRIHLTHIVQAQYNEEPSNSMSPSVAISGVRTLPFDPSRAKILWQLEFDLEGESDVRVKHSSE